MGRLKQVRIQANRRRLKNVSRFSEEMADSLRWFDGQGTYAQQTLRQTADSYVRVLRYLVTYKKNISAVNLSLREWKTYRRYLLKVKNHKISVYSNELKAMNRFFSYYTAIYSGVVSPLVGVKSEREKRSDRETCSAGTLEKSLIKLLPYRTCLSLQAVLFWALIAETGIRKVEAICLLHRNVKKRGEVYFIRVKGKGQGLREVPIREEMYIFIKKTCQYLMIPTKGYVFFIDQIDTDDVSTTGRTRSLSFHLELYSGTRFNALSFRRNLATELSDKVSLPILSVILGHRDFETTNLYIQRRRKTMMDWVNRLDVRRRIS